MFEIFLKLGLGDDNSEISFQELSINKMAFKVCKVNDRPNGLLLVVFGNILVTLVIFG